MRWQAWVSKMLGDLLAKASTICAPPPPQQVSDAMKNLINLTVEGNATEFARLIRSTSGTVSDWTRRMRRLDLASALHVCFTCGVTLTDLLWADPKTLQPHITRTTTCSQIQGRVRFPPQRKVDIQLELQSTAASKQYPPIPLTEVARRCGFHSQTLRRRNPAACDAISARYRAYIRQEKDQRLRSLGD